MKFSELIEQAKREITSNKKTAEKLSQLNQQQFSWQPAKGKWSIVQILEHLNLVSRNYLNKIRYDKVKKSMEDGEYKPSFLGKLLTKNFAQIPIKRNFKTTKAYTAENNLNGAIVLQEFFNNQDKMMALFDNSIGVDLNKNKIPSPAASFIKFKFGDVFSMDGKHTARHLYQIEKVMETVGFPQ